MGVSVWASMEAMTSSCRSSCTRRDLASLSVDSLVKSPLEKYRKEMTCGIFEILDDSTFLFHCYTG